MIPKSAEGDTTQGKRILTVIPAKAGIQGYHASDFSMNKSYEPRQAPSGRISGHWIPAFAGMTAAEI